MTMRLTRRGALAGGAALAASFSVVTSPRAAPEAQKITPALI
jgi:hypothetical protein